MFAYGEKKRLFQTNRIYLIPAFYPSFTPVILHPEYLLPTTCHSIEALVILGDPGADSGDEGKSKRAEKYGTKKSKERREEPLGTMSYQTSSKRSPFSGTNQKSERRRPFGTGLVRHCPQGLFSPFFTFLRATFFRPFRLSLAPFICPWVSEDER